MGTVKIVLRKKLNKDGTFPLTIRITKDRKSSFIHLGKNLKESDWDEVNQKVRKSHPNSSRLNNFLLKQLSEASNKLLELETQRSNISSKAVKKGLKSVSGISFFSVAQTHLDNIKARGKFKIYEIERLRVKLFKEFVKDEDLLFSDITVQLLNNFIAYLKGSRKVSVRTVMNYMILIRTVYNLGIKTNLADQKNYPFGSGKIVIKLPTSLKIGLQAEEVKRIEELDLPIGSDIDIARDTWLFSFYFAGIRISDILRLKWSDFQNERLFYTMGKNAKAGSLKIPEKAVKILAKYQDQKADNKGLVFPYLRSIDDFSDLYDVENKIRYNTHKINKALKEVALLTEINKPLSMHIARHTFGNISGEKISTQMLQKLYRHTSILTTIGYQSNFIHKDADAALDAVVDF
jgi:integrase